MKPPDNPRTLASLEEGIGKFRAKNAPAPASPPSGFRGAMRTGLELMSGVLVGSLVGWFLDQWLNTSPVLFILCFLLGAGGGFLTVYRTMQAMDKEGGDVIPPPAQMEDDED